MACVNSLKSIWEKTDSSYIQATKSGGRTPVSRRLFPQVSSEGNRPGKELQREEDECENASESSSSHEASGDFDAIPEEFRPSRRGKDLMKVRASPKKEDSKEKVSAEEPPQNERFSNKPNVSQTKRDTRNSNSSTIQNEARIYEKELLKTEDSQQPQRDNDMISDETGKQDKSSGIFFYSYSSKNESTSKATNGCQQNWSERENSRKSSEKSKFKNTQDENPYRRFYDSDSNQSKATNEFDIHSSFEKHKDETNFNKYNKNMPPKFRDRNATNQNRDKDEANFAKYNKNMPPKFQDRTGSNQNRASFADEGAQKITREVTVEKRIKWKNDLCEFKKPENKPNYFYEYTKTTKESVSYVPSHREDDNDVDEVEKRPYQDFKKGRDFCNNFRRTGFGQYRPRPENQKENGFDSTCKAQRNEAKHFTRERPQKPANKFEEKHNCFQCCNGKDPIIVKHEIKVIHVNQQGKNNRMFHSSSQTFRPYKQRNGKIVNNHTIERNGRMINTDTGERNGKIINNDPRERNGKMINTDTRERNGKIINTVTREYCGGKIEEHTMTKTAEGFQETRKNYVRIPLKLAGSSSKTENAHDVSRASNSKNGAALIKYGRDISDMIAGSYVAITTFLDNYEQWKDFRRVTMLLFDEVEKNLSQSCHRNKRIIEVAELVGAGCKMVQYVPHVGVSVAAKVIAFLSDVVARIFSSSNSAKSIGMDDFQLKLSLQRDMEATTDIYMYGMQCDINFQETCQLIEEFHREIQDERFKEFEETFETGFVKEMSLLNPEHPAVFYKKLGRIYKLLNEHQRSEEGKAFCGAFEDWPDALTTVSRLHRRFKTENWDSSSVMKAWEEVYNLLQNDQSVVEDVLKRIQDCICVLVREQSVMERYVMDLQRQC